MTLPISTFPNVHEPNGKREVLEWEALAERLAHHLIRPVKDGPGWSPAQFVTDPPYRLAANVSHVTALVLDCDSTEAVRVVIEHVKARRLECVLHSTFSSTTECRRARAVIPLSYPVPVDQWRWFWTRATAELAGGAQDPQCKDPGRFYWWPACPKDDIPWTKHFPGDWLDPTEFLRPAVETLVGAAEGHLGEGRNAAGMWLACQMRDNGYSQVETENARWHDYVARDKPGPNGTANIYDEREWLETVRKVYQRSARQPWVPTNGKSEPPDPAFANGQTPDPEASVVWVVKEKESGGGASDVSVVNGKEYRLAPEAYHGLPGRVMRTIDPQTESDAAGILASFLTAGGCLLGPACFVARDGQDHACNEFVLLLGKTASGKGTASRRVDQLFRAASGYDSESYDLNDQRVFRDMHEGEQEAGEPEDHQWADLWIRGLGSGEALVSGLAAETREGFVDPRRIVFESEFARCLKVMAREGSTLGDVLKNAWDSEPMQCRTKGSIIRVDRSHVAILAHATEHDVKRYLGDTELFNGFANRFLILNVSRSKSLPFGGGEINLAPLVHSVHAALLWSKRRRRMEFDTDACRIWANPDGEGFGGIYQRLRQPAPGLLGPITDRAASHVTRIALQYAVWDQSETIQVPHLLAGLAVWDYSYRTCVGMFGHSTGDRYADLILEKLWEVTPGFLTRKDIRDLFARNAEAGRIPAALEILEEAGLIRRGKMETGGHPSEVIALTEKNLYDQYDQSPLGEARRQAKALGYAVLA